MTRMLCGHIFPDIYNHALVDQRNSKECAIKARGAVGDVSSLFHSLAPHLLWQVRTST